MAAARHGGSGVRSHPAVGWVVSEIRGKKETESIMNLCITLKVIHGPNIKKK